MSPVGDIERITQDRVIALFTKPDGLGYTYLGNWHDRPDNSNIEECLLSNYLQGNGYTQTLIKKAIYELKKVAGVQNKNLYGINKDVYTILRYGVKVREDVGENTRTVRLIDWENPQNNHFAIAEEVSIKGENRKRPDIVIYVNGIALGVLELKRSTVSVSEGIRQNLDNQKSMFIMPFFATVQLVMAGNDTEGVRYGVINTPEKYYLKWKEESDVTNLLDRHLLQMCNKARFLELIHDFIVFDAGIKKICRHNQYFGVKALQKRVREREGGIIWHTQGSGKSMIMVWLTKWIRENIQDARVLIITDRDELDKQIEKVFKGVDEQIHRTKSGRDLVDKLNLSLPWLMCSLIHKFGNKEEADYEGFIEDISRYLPCDFSAKGDIFVYVDEFHRTQSGELHKAMKKILPDAMFIGFTGTPLLKADKQRSIEIFGSYIHTYKFDEAVKDNVILDLRYEACKYYELFQSAGLLSDRLQKAKELLDDALESIRTLCEPVRIPKETIDYIRYFCAENIEDKEEIKRNEQKRLAFYKQVSHFVRAYAAIANEMEEAGYTSANAENTLKEVRHYEHARAEVKLASADYIDLKAYEPAMRHLIDTYTNAEESKVISAFDDMSLVELIVERGENAIEKLPSGIRRNRQAVVETIENNLRKVIHDERPINPRYYENMSQLLDELIAQRWQEALEYEEYLAMIVELTRQIKRPNEIKYPKTLDTRAKRALYDNLDQNEELAMVVD